MALVLKIFLNVILNQSSHEFTNNICKAEQPIVDLIRSVTTLKHRLHKRMHSCRMTTQPFLSTL